MISETPFVQYEIEVNNKCNKKCEFCFRVPKEDEREISADILRDAIQFCLNSKDHWKTDRAVGINLFLKEPILSFPIIKEAFNDLPSNPQKAYYLLFTNGEALTQEMVSFFIEKRIHVRLSATKESSLITLSPLLQLLADKGLLTAVYNVYQDTAVTFTKQIHLLSFLPSIILAPMDSPPKDLFTLLTPEETLKLITPLPPTHLESEIMVDMQGNIRYFSALDKETQDTSLGTIYDFNNKAYADVIKRISSLQINEELLYDNIRELWERMRVLKEQKDNSLLSEELYAEVVTKTKRQGYVVNLTNRCNLNCYYCFTEQKPQDMSFDTLKAVISFIIRDSDPCAPISICFFGGEPLLKFDDLIVPILAWVKENNLDKKYTFKWGITTNGTLLTEEKAKFLHENKVGLLLSADGDEETQNHNRACHNNSKEKSFDMLKRNIPGILKYYPEVTFRATLTPFSVDKMVENYLFIRNSGFQHMFFMPNPFDDWDESYNDRIIKNVLEIARIMQIDIDNRRFPTLFRPLFGQVQAVLNPLSEPAIKPMGSCGWGTISAGIGVNGEIYGCQEKNTLPPDNLYYIGDIYTGIDPLKHRKLLAQFNDSTNMQVEVHRQDKCQTCFLRPHCSQNVCQSHSYDLFGRHNMIPPIVCLWNRALYSAARLMVEYNGDAEGFAEAYRIFLKGGNNQL